jgi:hypothetical protein
MCKVKETDAEGSEHNFVTPNVLEGKCHAFVEVSTDDTLFFFLWVLSAYSESMTETKADIFLRVHYGNGTTRQLH